jgi:two-component system LytT family response regulator
MPIVIFTTAYDQYAVRAFEAHALDYLLKPFDQDRLHSAIERTRAELLKTNDRALTNRLLDLLAQARTESKVDRRLVIKAGGRVVFSSFASTALPSPMSARSRNCSPATAANTLSS